MILEEETFEKFGYYPSDWAPKSNKHILAACDDCGKVRVIRKGSYRALCASCARKGEKNHFWHGGKVKRICKQCGKVSWVWPSYKDRLFCSQKCYAKWESEHRKGENNPRWNGGEIERICEACGRHFFTTPYWIKNGYARFCSQRCTHNFMRGVNATNWKGRIERVCETCGKHFLVRPWFVKKGLGRFCSKACVRQAIKMPTHHTKPEMIFEAICKKYNLPFKYTGDGSLWIGKNPAINPDFVECNGKKIAIEIFSYWHDPLRRNGKVRYSHTYAGRKKILKKYGWKLIVFWQEDLEREDAERFGLNELNKFGIQVPPFEPL